MQIYKALQPISVLSFDLDDTLYDNKPVIAAAEAAMLNSLAQHAPITRGYNSEFWWQQRRILAKKQPEIRHDMGRWRLLGIEAGLINLGLSQCEAGEIAEVAYEAFWQARTTISIAPDVIQLLRQLALQYQLVAITNGNACVKKMGLGDIFKFSLQAGPDGRMKPYPDLFLTAAQRLNVSPNAILHIGDSHRADVMGALNAGCQAAWLDHLQHPVAVLPHIHITRLDMLNLFI
ncbi:HAD-IA family hydrolase [Alishewanella tabrizica]|uniref:2-haloalkanoic acid dehalogenase n=1 Tax=Alishewanella tabrizica TaxID=671278 RepID=A0ABQ2WR54_9ALTE|nr:HAD-IA family hydrolase [Alishewanella tabrizica]GGW69370.1 2-haloalkanoic acid dehalogenase [Alishewanella tabrizica]